MIEQLENKEDEKHEQSSAIEEDSSELSVIMEVRNEDGLLTPRIEVVGQTPIKREKYQQIQLDDVEADDVGPQAD